MNGEKGACNVNFLFNKNKDKVSPDKKFSNIDHILKCRCNQ